EEQGNDALVEIFDTTGAALARADHPERRSGTRRAAVTPGDSRPVTVRRTGKEHAVAAGAAAVRAFDLGELGARPDCLAALKSLAQGDSDYASAQEISRGRAVASAHDVRDVYLRAAQAYASAESALAAREDQ